MVRGQEETLNYYNGIARGYKELYHEEQIEKISLVREYLPKKGLILDLGSGDGVLNQFLENQNIISLDLSEELLKLNSNNNKICGSILSLPFQDNSFEVILSFTVIQDIENTEKVISEIARVLSSKGKIIVSFLKMSSKKEKIEQEIEKYFEIEKEFEEVKDKIIIGRKK